MTSQGGSAGFRVHPDELQAAGRTAEDIAAQVPAEMRPVLGESDRTVGVLGRCESGAALGECTEAWHQVLSDLATSMDRRGQGLIESARAYQSADADAASGFSAAGVG